MIINMDLCCELPKIPNLLEHFAEHQADDGDSFLQFLVEDYIDHGTGEDHHNENEHDELPFHGSHQCQHTIVLFPSTLTFSIDINIQPLDSSKGAYRFTFSSPYLETPFQPPQFG